MRTIGTHEVDLGLTVAEDLDMGRLVIVDEDNDPKPICTQHSDHWTLTYQAGFSSAVREQIARSRSNTSLAEL